MNTIMLNNAEISYFEFPDICGLHLCGMHLKKHTKIGLIRPILRFFAISTGKQDPIFSNFSKFENATENYTK